jgi:hypothetical protein
MAQSAAQAAGRQIPAPTEDIMRTGMKGAIIAAAVAGMFCAGVALAEEHEGAKGAAEAQVHCQGINSCKGHGECAGVGHDCAGKNECKGKGWITTTEADCKAKGGTVAK